MSQQAQQTQSTQATTDSQRAAQAQAPTPDMVPSNQAVMEILSGLSPELAEEVDDALDPVRGLVEAGAEPALDSVGPPVFYTESQLLMMPIYDFECYVDDLILRYTGRNTCFSHPGLAEDQAVSAGEDSAVGEEQEPVDVYMNQRDNDAVSVETYPKGGGSEKSTRYGDQQCSPVSAAMGLVTLAGSEEAFKAETATLIDKNHGTPPAQDKGCDEHFIALMLCIDWDAAYTADPACFSNAPDWKHWKGPGDWYKFPEAQSYAASLYSFCGNKGNCGFNIEGADGWDLMLAEVEAGHQLSFQATFSGLPHVVHIQQMDDSSIVVHDPYGLPVPGGAKYLKNGCSIQSLPGKTKAEQKAIAKKGAEARGCGASVFAAIEAGEEREDWGMNLSYTRTELKGMKMKWALSLKGA